MPAPYPQEGVTKSIPLSQQANVIYGHYVWLARWSNEIGSDVDIDLKKLAQLGFIHCRLFADATATISTELSEATRARFLKEGITWSSVADMLTDLAALRAEALLLHVYVRDNVSEARSATEIIFSETQNSGREQVKTLPKPHASTAKVAKLRALFT